MIWSALSFTPDESMFLSSNESGAIINKMKKRLDKIEFFTIIENEVQLQL